MCSPIVYLYYCYCYCIFINLYVGFQFYYVCIFLLHTYHLGLLSRTLTVTNLFWNCKVAILVRHQTLIKCLGETNILSFNKVLIKTNDARECNGHKNTYTITNICLPITLKMEKHESHKEKQGWNHGLLKGKQFLLHWWHPSCYSCQQSSDNLSWKGALSTGKTYSRWDKKVRL